MSQVLNSKKGYKLVKGLFGKYEEIPQEWVIAKFSEYSKIVVGHVGSTSEYYRDSGILFLRTTNVKENHPDLTNVKFITKEFHEKLKKSQLMSGDILISRVGIAGTACLIPEDFPESNCANVLILRSKKGLIPKFLCYLLNSENISRQVKAKEAGGVQSVINSQTFEKLTIQIPSISEQKKIATILFNIDNLITNTQKIINQTNSLKKGLMQKLLTKGIGHNKFKKVKVRFGIEIEIPEEWKLVKVESIADKLLSGGTPSTSISEYWEGDIAWTKGATLTTHYTTKGERSISKEGLNNSSTSIIPKDNLLVVSRVSIGNISINKIDIAINQDITAIIPNKSLCSTEFLYWSLFDSISILVSFSQGTTIQGFTRKDLLNHRIFLPPLSEQQKIFSILFNIDSRIQSQTQFKEKLDRLKKSLMQKLLTGEVRVTV